MLRLSIHAGVFTFKCKRYVPLTVPDVGAITRSAIASDNPASSCLPYYVGGRVHPSFLRKRLASSELTDKAATVIADRALHDLL
jgi:hypothetical protein